LSDAAPVQDVADAALHDLELDAVFTRSWVIAGPLDRLANPGDHLVSRIAHVPVLITRARDGALHGFVNVCRHRAYPVATADGCRQLLQCAYHAWTYELDGRLNRAPRAEAEPGFDKADFSLVRVAVDTWGPLVWANPDPAAPPLRDAYPELDALAAEHGVDLAAVTLRTRSAETVHEDWKSHLERASEAHHAPAGASAYVDGARVLARFPVADTAGPRSLLVWPASLIVADDGVVTAHSITPDLAGTCRRQTSVLARDGVEPGPAADPATAPPSDADNHVARFQRLAWQRFAAAHGIAT
jgi:nitrite reductase/ring-hydroxylating ferredoxin subunit